MPLQETLERGGHTVTWDGASASGPTEATPPADLVVLDADSEGCIEASAAWREFDPPPGILLIGQSKAAQENAAKARGTFVRSNSNDQLFEHHIQSILKLRFAGEMSPSYARAALGLGPSIDNSKDAERIVIGSRQVDVDLVRECLRWRATEYITANEKIAELRATRTLTIPEVDLAKMLDGTCTVQSYVAPSHADGVMRGRFLWGLFSCNSVRA